MQGYTGNVLRINLTDGSSKVEPLRMDWAEKYLGSKGLSIRYLYDEIPAGTDPLSPENKILFTTGPFTGTPVPCSGKLAVTSKSPATGTISDASIGGHIGAEIKFAGYDMVIIEGKADAPSYILIEDYKVTVEDAAGVWGRGAYEAEDILTEKYGHDHCVMAIGPAGENLSNMACINTDYYRQAGRGGLGAVLGSKNIKAVVVKGTGSVKVPDIEKTTDRIIEILTSDVLQEDNTFVFDVGTTAFLEACNDGGILPKNNFSDTTDADWVKYNGDVLMNYRQGKRGCGCCGLGCGNFMKFKGGQVEGPEYETISVAGPNAGVTDPELILKYNEVADDMGLDTISAGDVIVWAMEMTEKGIYDFGIKFGEGEKMQDILRMMAYREGFGADLADGVKKVAEKYGGSEYTLEVKGLEYPQYEPRGSWGMSLSYAVSDRGACHMRAYAPNSEVFEAAIPPYTAEGKGQLVYELGEFNAVKFSACICDFWATLSYEIMAELLTLVTGREWTEQDMSDVGRRVINIARAFNQREGFSRKEDTIPKRLVKEALRSGPAAGQKIPQEAFDDMLDQYYGIMCWSKNGIMPDELVASLL